MTMVVIVGAGRGGRALLEMFMGDPTVSVLGMADVHPWVPGPLRERLEDIPILAYHFPWKAEAKVNKKVDRLLPEALDVLTRYAWPGNLRELENILERAVALTTSRQIEPAHLPLRLKEGSRLTLSARESWRPRSGWWPSSSGRRSFGSINPKNYRNEKTASHK